MAAWTDAVFSMDAARGAEAAVWRDEAGVRPVPVTVNDEAAQQEAVAALVPAYAALLFQVAHAVLRSRADAEDVVQETFVRVLRHRAALPQVREMRVWLVRIAWNLALDRTRRVRPEAMDRTFAEALAGRDLPADVALARAEEYGRVLREMERLPRAEREALTLSAVEEMTAAEMAGVLGRSESAVRALVFRARTRLKERLATREGGGR